MTAGGGKYYRIAIFILLLLMAGCDRQTRYAVVSTLFTGVPPYDEYYANEAAKKDADAALRESPATIYSHTFFAEGKCDACHTQTQDSLPQPGRLDKTITADVEGRDAPLSAPLRIAAAKLCLECHIDKSPRQAIRKRLVLHAPVAAGNCLGCHAAHSSEQKALLVTERPLLCVSCHEPDKAVLPADCFNTPPGYDKKEVHCLVCHNPHMGSSRSLLSSEYTEVKSVTVKRSISNEN